MNLATRDVTARIGGSPEQALTAWEIASVVASALIAEWVVLSIGDGAQWLIAFPLISAFAFIIYSQLTRGESWRDLGCRVDNFGAAMRLLLPPMLAATIFCLAVGWFNESVNFSRWRGGQTILGMPALGFLWGLLQQFILQAFINRRAQMIWGAGWKSVLSVAFVFAALHLPNPLLTLATFTGGAVWAAVYQRTPNLFALGLSHSIMTWVLISNIPPAALHGLRVGFKYFG
ncbi:MAG: CPBP family intramembrane metalloprotease [Pyrinomonadaceae bacterium]|nr:CPBP family intramembrane metalloprotease [Pyrinomonadaceae bacterium]